ncbi:hypothetical protein CCUS01_15014 [Colletotrichum cuscutae]|uniref:Uncharacterized protein n=1 Tax=Colletotrichum cuscutae TaxID=1209917 RepID=A0AAI9VG87_9PEZI|nr:hypothetical protein CCUS01_15014 [Colletotrichum cuscutae]
MTIETHPSEASHLSQLLKVDQTHDINPVPNLDELLRDTSWPQTTQTHLPVFPPRTSPCESRRHPNHTTYHHTGFSASCDIRSSRLSNVRRRKPNTAGAASQHGHDSVSCPGRELHRATECSAQASLSFSTQLR